MILDRFRLNGKVALVTGANSGLGEGICLGLAEAGADVVGIDQGELMHVRTKVEATGREFLDITANLKSIEPIPGIIHQILRRFGHIDILVNNAGIARKADALDFTESDWDDVMNLNIKSMFFFSQAVAKQFIKQGTGGKIINMASIYSFQGGWQLSSYTASKSGVLGLTRLMANEWARYQINVNAIAPGYIEGNSPELFPTDEAQQSDILGRIPASRWGRTDDVQGAAVFLASAASDYINGFTLVVDGGWMVR